MSDFLKIFFIVCAMAAAFFVGRGYGEQTFFASEDYKNIAKTKEELDYTRSELENAKVKLQNIIDGADRQKTDELLAQILQVFLADLGLQIQNRDLILQQAKSSTVTPAAPAEKIAEKPLVLPETPATESKENLTGSQLSALEKSADTDRKLGQFKSDEWLLLNSEYNRKLLNKVTLKDFKKYLANANPEVNNCEAFLGRFKGSIKGADGSNQGSLSFELRNENSVYSGKVSWMNSPNPPISTFISGNCGLTAAPLMARFFTLSDTVSLQVYPISNNNELTGNVLEKLPAGKMNKVGTFRIRRLSI